MTGCAVIVPGRGRTTLFRNLLHLVTGLILDQERHADDGDEHDQGHDSDCRGGLRQLDRARWSSGRMGGAFCSCRCNAAGQPKTDAGERTVALDAETLRVLHAHQAVRDAEKALCGGKWVDQTGLLFTEPDGTPLHPAKVTDIFTELAAEAGLPPIRLHDLRHGAATLALAAGVDIKIVQDMLGHCHAITADTYTSVRPQVAHHAAEATAAIIPAAQPRIESEDPVYSAHAEPAWLHRRTRMERSNLVRSGILRVRTRVFNGETNTPLRHTCAMQVSM